MPIRLHEGQSLGYYTVDAKGTNGNDIYGSLRVAEFKPPNFKLDLSLDNGENAIAGGESVASLGSSARISSARRCRAATRMP